MKVSITVYRAVHDETGETHEGTAKEIAKILHVVPSSVNKAALQYGKLSKHWNIRKVGVLPKAPTYQECKFPQELLDEWDAVTKLFRRKGKKRLAKNTRVAEKTKCTNTYKPGINKKERA